MFEGLDWDVSYEHFDEIMSCAYSVSVFTSWGSPIDMVWIKSRLDDGPEACTPQREEPGPWHERRPHFRLDSTPSSGEEIPSDYLVPRRYAVEAIQALRLARRSPRRTSGKAGCPGAPCSAAFPPQPNATESGRWPPQAARRNPGGGHGQPEDQRPVAM